MHQPKPKSAPARLKSKFVKNRTNAMKEIEAWIRKDGEPFPVPEASRMSGQLTDNVTEERMLKAKLWELSKERYKFLSQNSYEQKVFSDRQQRKAGLRRVASASWDSRSRLGSTGDPANRAGAGSEELPSSGLDTPRHSSLTIEAGGGEATPVSKRTKSKNARFSLLDRLDPTKKRAPRSKSSDAKLLGNNPSDSASTASAAKLSDNNEEERLKSSKGQLKKTDSEAIITTGHSDTKFKHFTSQLRPRTSHLPATNFRNKTLLQETPASESTQVEKAGKEKIEGRAGSAGPGVQCPHRPPTSPSTLTPSHPPPSNPNQNQQRRAFGLRQHLTATPITADPDESNTKPSSAGPSSRTPSATTRTEPSTAGAAPLPSRFGTPTAESMTHDPRYARLERTLCPLVRSKTTGDIGTIVNQIEALHVRPRKRPPDAKKTKIELKAFEYMKDKGFVF